MKSNSFSFIHTMRGFIKRAWYVLFLVGFILTVGLANLSWATDPGSLSAPPSSQLTQGVETQANSGDILTRIEHLEGIIQELRQHHPEKQLHLAQSLTDLGRLQLQVGQLEEALQSLEEAGKLYELFPPNHNTFQNLAEQSRVLRHLGFYPAACNLMLKAIGIESADLCQNGYLSQDDERLLNDIGLESGMTEQLRQAGLFRELGISLRSLGHLDEAVDVLSQDDNVAAQLSLANTRRAQGNLIRDRRASSRYDAMPWRLDVKDEFEGAWNCSPDSRAQDDEFIASTNICLNSYQDAQALYKKLAEDTSNPPLLKVQAALNSLTLQIDAGHWGNTNTNWSEQSPHSDDDSATCFQAGFNSAHRLATCIEENLAKLPMSQARIFSQISLARNFTFLSYPLGADDVIPVVPVGTETTVQNRVEQLMMSALVMAEDLNDDFTESYALGSIGSLYEYFGWVEDSQNGDEVAANTFRNQATSWTQKALQKAKTSGESDLIYQWQWQLGRLANATGDRIKALENYQNAEETLQAIRNDLLTVNTDVQFPFATM